MPIGLWFGFVVPPPIYFVFLVAAVIAYLGLTEIVKRSSYLYWLRRRRRNCKVPFSRTSASAAGQIFPE